MTNNQKWAIITLSFLLALVITIGGYGYHTIKQVSEILQSPAVTSEINIEGEFLIEGKDIDGVPVSLRIDRIQGKMNSKIIDLILSVMSD